MCLSDALPLSGGACVCGADEAQFPLFGASSHLHSPAPTGRGGVRVIFEFWFA